MDVSQFLPEINTVSYVLSYVDQRLSSAPMLQKLPFALSRAGYAMQLLTGAESDGNVTLRYCHMT
jgi:hypothetical protein